MLMAALKAEADSFVVRFGDELLPDGRQRVVRHGVICGAKRGSSYEPSLAAVVVNGREGAVDDELSGRHVRQRRMKEPSGKRSPASAAALMQATLCDRANGE